MTETTENNNTLPENITAQPENKPIVIEQKNSSGKGLATFALVLSLLGLGASTAIFVQGQNLLKLQELRVNQNLDQAQSRLNQDLEKAALGNSGNAVLLQNSLQKQQNIDSQLDRILQNEADTKQTLDGIHRAYAELLKGRVNWLVDEVEVTLNAASQQLLLSSNVPVAVTVLENIEARLNRFEQPELLPIKQAISQDLAALKNRPYLNISATVLRLDRLETGIATLPLLVDSTLTERNAKPEAVSQAGSFWSRAWENTAALLKTLVEVRTLDTNDAMLIAPEQAYFVRENLRLRLLDARVALLQHNGEVYQNDLGAIETTIKQYFDVNSPNAQAWLKEISELKSLEMRMVSDDALKASLAAVRDYQNNTRTALPVSIPETTIQTAVSAPITTPTPAVQAASAPSVQAASASATHVQATSAVGASAVQSASESK